MAFGLVPLSAWTTHLCFNLKHLPTSFEDNDDILHYWTIILRFDITSAFLIALLSKHNPVLDASSAPRFDISPWTFVYVS